MKRFSKSLSFLVLVVSLVFLSLASPVLAQKKQPANASTPGSTSLRECRYLLSEIEAKEKEMRAARAKLRASQAKLEKIAYDIGAAEVKVIEAKAELGKALKAVKKVKKQKQREAAEKKRRKASRIYQRAQRVLDLANAQNSAEERRQKLYKAEISVIKVKLDILKAKRKNNCSIPRPRKK